MGHLGTRQCSSDKARGRALVLAMAVRTLARRQCPLKACSAAVLSDKMPIAAPGTRIMVRYWFDVFQGGRQRCGGESVQPVTIPGRSIFWRCLPSSSSSSRCGIISIELLNRPVTRLSSCRAKACDGEALRLALLASVKTRGNFAAAAPRVPADEAFAGAADLAAVAHRSMMSPRRQPDHRRAA